MTAGIVSAIDRTITAPNNFSISGAIQTDAPINHGNSGGPLLDTSGKVVGINVQIDSNSNGSEGVGFATPIDTVTSVADTLIAGGKVQHAYLGIQVERRDEHRRCEGRHCRLGRPGRQGRRQGR